MLLDESINALSAKIKAKKISPRDLVNEAYDSIKKLEPKINSLITIVDKSQAIKQALASEKSTTKHSSPLHGIPFVLKDSYVTKDIQTTAASKVLGKYYPQYNATVYQKLLNAGAILIGKANMDAWGHGGTSENTDYGPVKNPWDTTRAAGGSSGGSAAAVAARIASFAIGEDTGGSIRNPASWCNITGLKVTYGRVSRYGCIAYASSFDTVGPMAKTSADCALVLKTIAGRDPNDATSSNKPIPKYSTTLGQKTSSKTIAIPEELLGSKLDQEIKQGIISAANRLKDLGHHIKQISMPSLSYALSTYYLIVPSETSSNLARYDGVRYGQQRNNFTPETTRRIMIGTYALSAGYYDAYYHKAQKVRTLLIKGFAKALSKSDVLLMPVTPTPATNIGYTENDPMKNILIDIFTTPQNLAGVPSLALPCGFTKSGLPFGLQLTGPMFSEPLLFQISHQYQQATNWHQQKPKSIKND